MRTKRVIQIETLKQNNTSFFYSSLRFVSPCFLVCFAFALPCASSQYVLKKPHVTQKRATAQINVSTRSEFHKKIHGTMPKHELEPKRAGEPKQQQESAIVYKRAQQRESCQPEWRKKCRSSEHVSSCRFAWQQWSERERE